jgi:hypothetical protein
MLLKRGSATLGTAVVLALGIAHPATAATASRHHAADAKPANSARPHPRADHFGHLENDRTGECLSTNEDTGAVFVEPCNADTPEQEWYYDSYDHQLINYYTLDCLTAGQPGWWVTTQWCGFGAEQRWDYDSGRKYFISESNNHCLERQLEGSKALTWQCAVPPVKPKQMEWRFVSH